MASSSLPFRGVIKAGDEPKQGRVRGIRKACKFDRVGRPDGGGVLFRYRAERPLRVFGLKGFEQGMTLKKRYEFVFQSGGPVHHL